MIIPAIPAPSYIHRQEPTTRHQFCRLLAFLRFQIPFVQIACQSGGVCEHELNELGPVKCMLCASSVPGLRLHWGGGCRTAALGGHIDQGTRWGHRATIAYNSRRNRYCPTCQTGAREQWLEHAAGNFCPRVTSMWFSHFPVLAPFQNKKIIYDLLLRANVENTSPGCP